MIAKYLGAVIFAMVGNYDKKAFLMNKYNISEDHIFSSRQTTFVQGIMRLTGDRGVDVVRTFRSKSFLLVAKLGYNTTCWRFCRGVPTCSLPKLAPEDKALEQTLSLIHTSAFELIRICAGT